MPRHTYVKDSLGGTRLGLLQIDYKTAWKYSVHPIYMCTCDCGNKVLMPINAIKRYKSCGCDKPNKSSYLIIKGDSVIREVEFKVKGEI